MSADAFQATPEAESSPEKFRVAQNLNHALRAYLDAWGAQRYQERLEHALAAHAKAEALRRG